MYFIIANQLIRRISNAPNQYWKILCIILINKINNNMGTDRTTSNESCLYI